MATFNSARQKFELAKNSADDQAIAAIAGGLIDLSSAIESEIRSLRSKLESDIRTVRNRVNTMRG